MHLKVEAVGLVHTNRANQAFSAAPPPPRARNKPNLLAAARGVGARQAVGDPKRARRAPGGGRGEEEQPELTP